MKTVEEENQVLEKELEDVLANKQNIPFQRDRDIDKRRYNNWLKRMRAIKARQSLRQV